jgi:hypothetical protein
MPVDPKKRKTTIEVTNSMKDYLRYIIILALITFLCAGFVSAAGLGAATEDKIANETMQIRLSLVSSPSETDQVKLADIKAMLPPEIQQSLDEQITFNESVTKAIADKEGQLVRSPLIINDSYDITGEAQGFFVGNTTIAPEPASTGSGLVQANIPSSAILSPVNQIPNGGFIEFGFDGKTRVFTSEGTQISYAVDDRSEKVTTPSGKVLSSTHIIGIPNGAASHIRGNAEYITLKGEVILTIIDNSSKEILGNRIVPSALSYPWVEYADSDPYYIAAVHSQWNIPHSPNLGINATNANILFNGVEPSDGSMIFQPVTAFNFYPHSLINGPGNRTDPAIVNRWTGASWICSNLGYCTHSAPVLSFSEGELAYGGIFWYEAPVLEWLVYLVNGTNQGTWLYSDRYIYFQPSRAVIAYEFAGSYPLGEKPFDDQKITSSTFSDISVWDTNGNQISSLHWNGVVNTKDHTRTSGLNVDLSQAPSTVKLITSDYRTKIGVYQNGVWHRDFNGDGSYSGGVTNTFPFVATGWTPVVGDWNYFNKTKIGVTNGATWYLDWNGNGIYETGTDKGYNFGTAGWTPVLGDWNHDGKTKIGIYLNGIWYLDYNGNGVWDGPTTDRLVTAFGLPGWTPVVGDWNGDGRTKVGVYKDGTWYLDYNGNGIWDGPTTDKFYNFGSPGWPSGLGDWKGNGKTKIGIYLNGIWYLDYNGNGVWDGPTTDKFYNFGSPGWPSVIGDWNQDGKTKIGIYKDGTWYLDYNGNGAWNDGIDKMYNFGTTGWTSVIGKWN